MKVAEVIGGLVWSASAVAVGGYTWQAYSGSRQPFPQLTGGFGGVLSQIGSAITGGVNAAEGAVADAANAVAGAATDAASAATGLDAPQKMPPQWIPPAALVRSLRLAVDSGSKPRVQAALNVIERWRISGRVPQQAVNAYLQHDTGDLWQKLQQIYLRSAGL